jgi:hypothetical protein
VFAEEPENIFSDAYVRFKDDDKEWYLRGRFMGYNKEGLGYIEIPVNSRTERLFHLDDVGDIFTKRFDKLKKGSAQLRLIWNHLVKEGFHREEKPEFLEISSTV